MYTGYAIWDDGSGGLEDDFFSDGVGVPNGNDKFFWGGGRIRQHSVTYRKHTALLYGCSIPVAE